MSTKDQTHSSRLHGEAMVEAERVAEHPAFADVMARLTKATDDPVERARVAGEIAGEAIAQLGQGGGNLGYRLIAAGLLLTSGVVDHDQLAPAVRRAYERGQEHWSL